MVALCVCPAVLAPPAIVAVHKPARHAVAHLLQRAAHRLDPAVLAVPAPAQYANIPCAPTLADSGSASGFPAIGGLASLIPGPDGAIYGDASHPGNGIGGGGDFGGGGGGGGGAGGGGIGGGGGGGGSGGGGLPGGGTVPGAPGGGTTPLPPELPGTPPSVGGSTMGSVPEPETWALLMAGFTVVGVGLRYRRVLTA